MCSTITAWDNISKLRFTNPNPVLIYLYHPFFPQKKQVDIWHPCSLVYAGFRSSVSYKTASLHSCLLVSGKKSCPYIKFLHLSIRCRWVWGFWWWSLSFFSQVLPFFFYIIIKLLVIGMSEIISIYTQAGITSAGILALVFPKQGEGNGNQISHTQSFCSHRH